MSNHRICRHCLAAMTALLLSAAGAAAQPQLDFSEAELGTGPLPSRIRDSIEQYVRHWAEEMAQTDADREVAEARRRIIEGFGRHPDSARYQHAYATAVAQYVRPVLNEQDLLKQVNAALVVAHTTHMGIRPALDEMVRHPNPAVRYLGWRGYRRVRNQVLAQGRDYSEPMFESLAERAVAEDVPYVVRRLLEMLYFPPVRPQAVSQSDYDYAMQQALEIFLRGWEVQCRRILAGEPEMPEAVERGLLALIGLERVVGETRAEKSILVQALLDAMYCASRAYDDADGDRIRAQRVRQANSSLLRRAEQHLNSLSELRRSHVYDALTEPGVPDRGASVRRAVLRWADDLTEAGFDVEEPRLEPLGTADQPAD